MNCLILDKSLHLPSTSPKIEHLKKVLKIAEDGEIFVGEKNGALLLCKIHWQPDGSASFEPIRELKNPPFAGIALAVAFPRPQIAQRLLFESACFGAEKLIFYPSDKSETSYAKSSLYTSGEYEKYLEKGAEQACSTLIPKFEIAEDFQDAIKKLSSIEKAFKIAPDPYEASDTLANAISSLKNANGFREKKVSFIFGSERGFSNIERQTLRDANFTLCTLGDRILRTDTAVISALSIASTSPYSEK